MTMPKHSEKHLLYTALMFYTRIRVPANTPYSPELLSESRKYFTSIGLIIGTIACAVFLLCQLVLPNSVAVLLSMISTILATGAFHEDGFADSCDALGGGWKTEQVLSIMKDSRIGTYGTVGLTGVLALKYCALYHLSLLGPETWCLCCICAHSTSRLHTSRAIKHNQYVQDVDKSKVKPMANEPLNTQSECFEILVAMLPCVILTTYSATATILAISLGYLLARKFMTYCNARIGGYTGDILGAIQQLTEVAFLITCLAIL